MSASRPFLALGVSEALVSVVEELGFTAPTPIQSEAIPVLLAGRDLVAQASTGSGKTVAFALPTLQRISVEDRTLQALVLCPTRELAAQVAREFRKLGRKHAGLRVLELAGGQPVHLQLKALAAGAHVAVGTPGRVVDLLRREALVPGSVRMLVLDEADRMLDMGFEEDMTRVLDALPPARQTAFFSATWPESVESLTRRWQRDPVRRTGGAIERPPEIAQVHLPVRDDGKMRALVALLRSERPASALVFCNQKATAAAVEQALKESGISAAALHGDMEQPDRDRVMARFRNRSVRILVATDVAARGLDVENLDLVVNLDLPPQPEVYVHRIGRTARAGMTGRAVALASSVDLPKLRAIEAFTGTRIPPTELKPTRSDEPLRAEMETLFISGGRKDKLRPGDILGALTGDAGLAAGDVGKIEIHDHVSYVAVSYRMAQLAVQRLKEGKIKGRRLRIGIAP